MTDDRLTISRAMDQQLSEHLDEREDEDERDPEGAAWDRAEKLWELETGR